MFGTADLPQALEQIEMSQPRLHRLPTSDCIVSYLARQGFAATEPLQRRVEAQLPEAYRARSMRSLGCIVPVGSGECVAQHGLPAGIRQADALGIGLCTASEEIDHSAAQLRADGRWIDAWIWDACGITALADLEDNLAREMWAWALARGIRASAAYAPGVASSAWALSHQRLIFRLLPADQIGVCLTPNLWMHPVKSRSFVVGIGKRIAQAETPFDCGDCNDGACVYRQARSQATVATTCASGGSR